MTYCVAIMTHEGLVMASDSRTNAGYDQVNVCRKMHSFVIEGERAFVILTSGSLSLTQSVVTLLRDDFNAGEGLASAATMYAAARVVGDAVRRVSDMDRAALERDDYNFNIHLLLGGQVKGAPADLYLVYPQGNPLNATEDSPYLQVGEIWQADPRSRHRAWLDFAGDGGEVRAAFVRRGHALKRYGGAADRAADLSRWGPQWRRLQKLQGGRSRIAGDSQALGALIAARS
jgi:hypothetical protein